MGSFRSLDTGTPRARTLDGAGKAVGSEIPVIGGTVWGATDTGGGHVITVNADKVRIVKVDAAGSVAGQADLSVPSVSYPAATWFMGRLLVLPGLTLEVRDGALAKISGPFPFAADVPGGGYYASMASGTTRVAGVVGFDGTGGMAKLRFFGKDGCD